MKETASPRTLGQTMQPDAVAARRHDRGVSVRDLRKTFRRRNSNEEVPAVAGIDLDVDPGELVVLLGPSGCGKTTLLRCIAGLEIPDSGKIEVDGRVVFDSTGRIDVPVERRPASMVFQSYALWPHMTAFENVTYPLRSRGIKRQQAGEQADKILETVGIGAVRDQYPAQLSGGQQQRVSLARAIVAGQKVILFDEPLSNVDAKVRDHLRLEIQQMQQKLGFTALYVTHDQEEAMMLGDRIAVLQEGQIAQLGTPQELYASPASRYVADFVGTADQLEGEVTEIAGGHLVIGTGVGELRARSQDIPVGSKVVAMMRPEAWRLAAGTNANATTGLNELRGTLLDSLFLGGGKMEYVLDVGSRTLRAWGFDPSIRLAPGDEITLSYTPEDLMVYPADDQ